MKTPNEEFIEQNVTYTLEMNGKFFIVENVPARISTKTGEQFFSPATVEHLHETIHSPKKPSRFVQTPVYEFTS